MREHNSLGFSLTELLVVIAIIVLLIGLLIPTVRSVQRSARQTKCLTNIRSLQIAHVTYYTDHDGYFIDMGLPHGGLPNEEVAWINTLATYYDNELVVRSPLDTSPHWPVADDGQGIPVPGTTNLFRRTSYGSNNYLSRSFSPQAAVDPTQVVDRIGRVKNPAGTVQFVVMAFEGDFAGADHVHVEEWWVNDSAVNLPPVQAAQHVQTNSVKGQPADWAAMSNYGFLDGHAESLPFHDVYLNDALNRFDPDVVNQFLMHRARNR